MTNALKTSVLNQNEFAQAFPIHVATQHLRDLHQTLALINADGVTGNGTFRSDSFCTIARQRLMHFSQFEPSGSVVYFTGWSVIGHTRPNRNIIKQIFDIVIAQTNTALTYPEPNTKIGIGTMDGIQPASINRAYSPMGLSGPAGTVARGKFSPRSAYSRRVFGVGVQVGASCLRSTVVTQLRRV